MENIEIKLECRDADLARAICRSYGAVFAGTLRQTDTYFRVPGGRLKKRETPGEEAEYIQYERADEARPRRSIFALYTPKEARRKFGRRALPVWVVVRKKRDLFLTGNIRIHIDDVEGLGRFVEFEALVSSSQSAARCRKAIAKLREVLTPALGEPIALGYADLLAAEADAG